MGYWVQVKLLILKEAGNDFSFTNRLLYQLSYLGPVVVKGLIPSRSRNLASSLRCSRPRFTNVLLTSVEETFTHLILALSESSRKLLGLQAFAWNLDLAGRHFYSPSFSPDLRAADS
jgi:hypothetical protein